MFNKAFAAAALALSASRLVSAQTFTDCNPLEKSKKSTTDASEDIMTLTSAQPALLSPLSVTRRSTAT